MGYSTRQIANQLNRHHSTISGELKRNATKAYQAELADQLAQNGRLVCHRQEKKSEEVTHAHILAYRGGRRLDI